MKPTLRNRVRLWFHTFFHWHRRVSLWRVELLSPPRYTNTAIYCECGFGKEINKYVD